MLQLYFKSIYYVSSHCLYIFYNDFPYINSCSQFRVQRSTLYKLQDGLLALNCPCDCYFLVIVVLLNIYDTGMFSAQMGTKANEWANLDFLIDIPGSQQLFLNFYSPMSSLHFHLLSHSHNYSTLLPVNCAYAVLYLTEYPHAPVTANFQ